MKTTLDIDEALLETASRLTGITDKAALVKRGLEALIVTEDAKRLLRARRQRRTAARGASPQSTASP